MALILLYLLIIILLVQLHQIKKRLDRLVEVYYEPPRKRKHPKKMRFVDRLEDAQDSDEPTISHQKERGKSNESERKTYQNERSGYRGKNKGNRDRDNGSGTDHRDND